MLSGGVHTVQGFSTSELQIDYFPTDGIRSPENTRGQITLEGQEIQADWFIYLTFPEGLSTIREKNTNNEIRMARFSRTCIDR